MNSINFGEYKSLALSLYYAALVGVTTWMFFDTVRGGFYMFSTIFTLLCGVSSLVEPPKGKIS